MTTTTIPEYAITDASGSTVESWPKTAEGVIMATTRAAHLSRRGGPHTVRRPDSTPLARYIGGRRADLPPGGIIRLADAKAATL